MSHDMMWHKPGHDAGVEWASQVASTDELEQLATSRNADPFAWDEVFADGTDDAAEAYSVADAIFSVPERLFALISTDLAAQGDREKAATFWAEAFAGHFSGEPLDTLPAMAYRGFADGALTVWSRSQA